MGDVPRVLSGLEDFEVTGAVDMQRLAAQALTEVRCRHQTEVTGHRGRKGDPL